MLFLDVSVAVPKSCSKGQPRSTKNDSVSDSGRLRKFSKSSNMAAQTRWKLTAKGAVLSPEKRDFTVLLTKFAFIVIFEEFLVP